MSPCVKFPSLALTLKTSAKNPDPIISNFSKSSMQLSDSTASRSTDSRGELGRRGLNGEPTCVGEPLFRQLSADLLREIFRGPCFPAVAGDSSEHRLVLAGSCFSGLGSCKSIAGRWVSWSFDSESEEISACTSWFARAMSTWASTPFSTTRGLASFSLSVKRELPLGLFLGLFLLKRLQKTQLIAFCTAVNARFYDYVHRG